MSIDQNGLNDKIQGAIIAVEIENDHPLILLGNILPWSEFFDIILPDLQSSTEKGKWWCGRALKVRIHLGAYILQQLFNKKDRQIEAGRLETFRAGKEASSPRPRRTLH